MPVSKSLYVHIPFCRSKCAYCDFFSRGKSSGVPEDYLDALLNEISFHKYTSCIDSFKTVYVGGGTPSLLSPAQLSALLQAACSGLTPPDEVTVEMNPESLSERLLEAFSSCPAKRRRLSLGIQSLNESALTSVGRNCSPSTIQESLARVRQFWRHELCLDLIAGLPCQTTEEFTNSLKACISYGPDHLSLYSLTVEEGTPLHGSILRKETVWDEDEADRQWLAGREILEQAGYVQYEVSNFCREGHKSRHNLAYWRQEDYIGAGSGATGSIYSFSGGCGFRWTNTQDIRAYTDFWKDGDTKDAPMIPRETEELPLETEEYEFLMMGLRSTEGISSAEYRRRFSAVAPWKGDLRARLGVDRGAWERFSSQKGIAEGCRCRKEDDGERYWFTGKALSFLNTFLRHLT